MIELLILALIEVESGNDPKAEGDYYAGIPQAYGILQIHECVIQDVNEYIENNDTQHKKKFTHEDAFHPEMAKEIFRLYMARYATRERLGRHATMEDMARIWNGGPMGHKKTSTKVYWERVQSVLLMQKEIHNR
jgi:hypothetical protein